MSASMSVSLLSASGEEGVVRDLQRLRSALNLSYGPLGVYVLFSNTASSRARNNTCCILRFTYAHLMIYFAVSILVYI